MNAGSPSPKKLTEADPLPPEDRAPGVQAVAVSDLYSRHRPRLLEFIGRRGPRDDAGDILHRVFVRFLSLGQTRIARIEAPEPYLRTAAGNMIRDDRKLAARRSIALHVPDEAVPLAAPCQIAALEARDMLDRIEAAMLKLKPLTREIFLAHRIDGFSYAEIAERTGLSVKGVEKHMSRAIAHLDRLLSAR